MSYDKNSSLPIIELDLNGKKMTYLLGHKKNDYHIIYNNDGENNEIAGKVILDDETKRCNVLWCENYPK